MLFDVIVVGAGISGLSAALSLKQKGFAIAILEKEPQVGGKIQTFQDSAGVSEFGPDTFLHKSPQLMQVISHLGLHDRLLASSESAKKRYIFLKKRVVALPIGLKQFLFSSFLPWYGKIRLALEPWQKSGPSDSESVADFFQRRMGRAAVENLFDPFVTGIYAGDVNKLGAKENFSGFVAVEKRYGSLFQFMARAMKRLAKRKKQGFKRKSGMFSFPNGLRELRDALQKQLGDDLFIGMNVDEVRREKKGWLVSCLDSNGKNRKFSAKTILFAIPAKELSSLLVKYDRELSDALNEIVYAPVSTGTLFYKPEDVVQELDGFGFLIPRKQKVDLLGSIWHGSLFPAHVASPLQALRFYLGGDTAPQLAHLSKEKTIEIVNRDLVKCGIIRDQAKPEAVHFHSDHAAIPQYYCGHSQIVARVEARLQTLPGIFLGGNYLRGVSLNDCVAESNRQIFRISRYLQKNE